MIDCIDGLGAARPNGYKRSTVAGVRDYAHRHAYREAVGPIPAGFDIDHLCRNRACVNPAHLEAVPRSVNVHRGDKTKLTAAAVRIIRASREHSLVLAKRYGVHRTTIINVRARRHWKEA